MFSDPTTKLHTITCSKQTVEDKRVIPFSGSLFTYAS